MTTSTPSNSSRSLPLPSLLPSACYKVRVVRSCMLVYHISHGSPLMIELNAQAKDTPPAPPAVATNQVSLLFEWNNNWSELWVRISFACCLRSCLQLFNLPSGCSRADRVLCDVSCSAFTVLVSAADDSCVVLSQSGNGVPDIACQVSETFPPRLAFSQPRVRSLCIDGSLLHSARRPISSMLSHICSLLSFECACFAVDRGPRRRSVLLHQHLQGDLPYVSPSCLPPLGRSTGPMRRVRLLLGSFRSALLVFPAPSSCCGL